MISAESFLLLISSTLFLCYVSGLIYTKTRIPDMVWILGLGVLLGPVLGYFEKETFIYLSPLMGVVAICIITFDSGIEIDIRVFTKVFIKSAALTVATFIVVVLSVGYAIHLLMANSFTLLEGMLLGTMVAGLSTVALKSLLEGMRRHIPRLESTNAILNLESTLCDPIRVVVAITIIRIIMEPGVSTRDSLKDIVYTFVVASGIGLAFSLAWAEVLDKCRGRPLNYVMTLAALFPIYLLAEAFAGDGGGTMASFVFGLVLANYRHVARRLGLNRNLRPDKRRIIEFNREITFLLKSYYFVYIGLIASLSSRYMLVGLSLVAIILAVRYAITTFIGRLLKFSMEELVISRLAFTLGTSTLVMSQLPSIFDAERVYFTHPEIYPDLCVPIVLGTILFTAIASPQIAKRQLKP